MPRPRAWDSTLINQDITTAGLNINLLANLAASDVKTVVRIIGHLGFAPDALPTTGETVQQIAMGIQVVAEEAFNAAVVPDPETAGEVPARGWLYHGIEQEFTHVVSSIIEVSRFPEVRFDIRASRKVDRGRLTFTLKKTTIVGSAHDLRLTGIIRSLCLV